MAYGDEDTQGLQMAIENSLGGRQSTTDTQFGGSASPSAQDSSGNPRRRTNIEDRIKDITLQSALELPLVNDPWGDTWVFIDAPPRQPEQDETDYNRYIERYERPMLVKKNLLLKYLVPDSTGGFNLEVLFGPSAQFRIIRRRKLTTLLRNQPNVKYVIDLTPPTEGEDAVYLTTELCCSDGVRLWYQASDIWSVSDILVGGREEYTSVRRHDLPANSQSRFKEDAGRSMGEGWIENTYSSSSSANVLMPLEYTPVRHRSAIERVIAALVGFDPKLDSAPKVWTTFAVAKYLGIQKSPVTDYIIRWLRAYPNSYFLEVCPEVSLRIADGLENHDLARDAFAILVGEEALESLVRARSSNVHLLYSVHGRRMEDLPENMYSRIEYASKSLLDRIRNDFSDFAGDEMIWVENLPEVQRLQSISHPALLGIVNALVSLLKKYVRGTLRKLLCLNYNYVPAPDFHRSGGEELIQRRSRSRVWANLTTSERILTRTYWQALVSFDLFEGSSNLEVSNGWGTDLDDSNLRSEESRELRLGKFSEIRNRQLRNLIISGDRLLAKALPLPTFDLPNRTRDYTDILQSTSDSKGIFQFDPELIRINQRASSYEDTPRPLEGPRRHHDAQTSDEGDLIHFGNDQRVPITWETLHDQSQSCAQPNYPHLSDESITDNPRPIDDLEPPDKLSTPPFFRHPQEPEGEYSTPGKEIQNDYGDPAPCKNDFFHLQNFFAQARAEIKDAAQRKLYAADYMLREEPHEVGITNTLVCLEDSEWKFLPLWAGGYDDDTGGVFEDQVPTADLGFTTPGPGIHTGITPANSNSTTSEFDIVRDDYEANTVNTSMDNNESSAGALNNKRVYAADSINCSSSDEFDMVTVDEDAKEYHAREWTEAQENFEANEEKATRVARTNESRREAMVDENYADLFNDDDEDEDTDRADDNDSVMDDDLEDEDTVMV